MAINTENIVEFLTRSGLPVLSFRYKNTETLMLDIPKPVSPREMGTGMDRHKRGIGIISIKIVQSFQ